SGAGRTSDGNGSHASTLKSPSYTKSVSWQHYLLIKHPKKINIITTYILANITPSSTITSSIQEYATLSD
ncbi:hypothetical protein, partial [Enterobacter roggenkampii]|uniref:hypothetical protein n=1 Tax=Enterobacter roggenkampii TaxID=1812935 RepID=UPI00207CAC2A